MVGATVVDDRVAMACVVNPRSQELGLPFDAELKVRDLWAKKDLAPVKGTFSATVASHDVVMLKVQR